MTAGETIAMNVTNNLTETTTTHWHGMHPPADMDGGPH
ncbi:MAG TPA: multicopper oxidase domain-containing protein [Herpetosiphonaceae bacterium]|nr:multicopper oxidase domain-containing protein [Herpetosiphonaceae bacterium]